MEKQKKHLKAPEFFLAILVDSSRYDQERKLSKLLRHFPKLFQQFQIEDNHQKEQKMIIASYVILYNA